MAPFLGYRGITLHRSRGRNLYALLLTPILRVGQRATSWNRRHQWGVGPWPPSYFEEADRLNYATAVPTRSVTSLDPADVAGSMARLVRLVSGDRPYIYDAGQPKTSRLLERSEDAHYQPLRLDAVNSIQEDPLSNCINSDARAGINATSITQTSGFFGIRVVALRRGPHKSRYRHWRRNLYARLFSAIRPYIQFLNRPRTPMGTRACSMRRSCAVGDLKPYMRSSPSGDTYRPGRPPCGHATLLAIRYPYSCVTEYRAPI